MQEDNKRLLNIYNASITYFQSEELHFLFHDKKPHNFSITISNDLVKINDNDYFSVFIFIILRILYQKMLNISLEIFDAGGNYRLEFENYDFRNIEDFYFELIYSNGDVDLDLRNIELAHIAVDKILLSKLYSNSIEALRFIHNHRLIENISSKNYLYSPFNYLQNDDFSKIFLSRDDKHKARIHSINEILNFDNDLYRQFQIESIQSNQNTLYESEFINNIDVIRHAHNAEMQVFECIKTMNMLMGKSNFESEKLAREECARRVEIAKSNGLYFTPPNLGELIFSNQSIKDSTINKLIEKVRSRLPYLESEGVTKHDIIKWWNIHYIERQKMVDDDMASRGAQIKYDMEHLDDLDYLSKLENYKKYFPTFREDRNSNNYIVDNPLPIELKIRVLEYNERTLMTDNASRKIYNEKIEKHTTFNAFVRSEIKNGNL